MHNHSNRVGRASHAAHLGRYPETFVLNRKGVFVEKVVGGFPWSDPQMKTILQAIYDTGGIPPLTRKDSSTP